MKIIVLISTIICCAFAADTPAIEEINITFASKVEMYTALF